MNFRLLIRRSLRFHARAHVGVVLGAVIGSAALIGALVVGDSVRESLRERALSRLGLFHFALSTPDKLFQASLGSRPFGDAKVSESLGNPVNPLFPSDSWNGTARIALVLPGMVTRQDGSARAQNVNVLGVESKSWLNYVWQDLARNRQLTAPWNAGQTAFINEALAQQLGVRRGDEIIVRVRKPSALGLDAAISPRDQNSIAFRLEVGLVLPSEQLGDFSLTASQLPQANLFLPLDFLADRVGTAGSANLMLVGALTTKRKIGAWERFRLEGSRWLWKVAPPTRTVRYQGHSTFYVVKANGLGARLALAMQPDLYQQAPDNQALSWLNAQIRATWLLYDAGLEVRSLEQPESSTGGEYIQPQIQVSSTQLFLPSSVATAALAPRTNLLTGHSGIVADTTNDVAFSRFVTNGVSVLTYLANLIMANDRSTPYSMVTAVGAPFVPAEMEDGEILVNEWLAEDLGVKPGDPLKLSYYVVDSGAHLIERTNSFRVKAIVPLKGRYADRTLMPEFPGLAKAESTHDWDAGFPLIYPIRDKDEAYWKKYRGTPKAFITLAAGQAMWANRFGSLTAIRYEVPTNSFASVYRDQVDRNLLANLNPADLGLRFEPVREQALRAADQSQDFGQLFIGFSLFLVVAALLLMALLFQFGLEQRATEIGTLLAIGFTARQVRRLFLLEGATLAFIGGVLGSLAGLGYARAMLWALTTIWRGATGTSALAFHTSATTLLSGIGASTFIAILTIWLALRKQARQPARELLTGEIGNPNAGRQRSKVRRLGLWIGLGCGLGALGLTGWVLAKHDTANAGAFFGAGTLLLLSGLGFASTWLGVLERRVPALREHSLGAPLSLAGLAVRGCARRRKRSLATISLLASAVFIILAIGVFRLDANADAASRSSGTGGFALLGQSTLPVLQDLNTQTGRESFGLNAKDLLGVSVVPFRVRNGDEASCLNLNRAQRPRVLGVNPEALAGRFTFTTPSRGESWQLLRRNLTAMAPTAQDEVPAIGDANSIQWALGKKIGDTLDYTDELGRNFKLRLVGAVANSVLQGNLIIDEAEFVKRFPTESGYRFFLIDVPANAVAQVSATLSRALQDLGLELTPAAQRLNVFNAVQNTYLGTFQILGGLGLLLGSAGLGIVVLRNVFERRGELALMLAVGFRRRTLRRLVLSEHAALLGCGLGLGLAAAALAVLPALLSPATQLPYASLGLTMAAVILNGIVWTWLATWYALRGNLLAALRNE